MAPGPPRRQGRPRIARKEAEAKFKALGEALGVLTDPFMRRLWDEGHDLESIAQHVQRCDHSRQDSRRAGTCNEFCAQSALVVPRAYGFSSTLLPVAWYDFKASSAREYAEF